MDETAAHSDRIGTWDHAGRQVIWDDLPTSSSRSKMILGKFDNDVYDIIESNADLLISKHHDYGPLNVAGWDRTTTSALTGLRVRMWDKICRINHLLDNDLHAQHESLEDSFRDLANYAVIAQMVLSGRWPGINDEHGQGV